MIPNIYIPAWVLGGFAIGAVVGRLYQYYYEQKPAIDNLIKQDLYIPKEDEK